LNINDVRRIIVEMVSRAVAMASYMVATQDRYLLRTDGDVIYFTLTETQSQRAQRPRTPVRGSEQRPRTTLPATQRKKK